jgi:hypothetical protein
MQKPVFKTLRLKKMEVRHYMTSKTLQLFTSCLTSAVVTAETCVWIQGRLRGVCD